MISQGWASDQLFERRKLSCTTSWADCFSHQAECLPHQAKLYDELGHVSGEEAMRVARELARREGILTGTSGGGVLAVALRKAATLPKGSCVLCMLPDTGERYLSTPLFDEVTADMTAEEKELFDSAPTTIAFPQPLPPPTDAARALVAAHVAKDKVAIVAMESCEFCWTAFKLFRAIGVECAANEPECH